MDPVYLSSTEEQPLAHFAGARYELRRDAKTMIKDMKRGIAMVFLPGISHDLYYLAALNQCARLTSYFGLMMFKPVLPLIYLMNYIVCRAFLCILEALTEI
jgi:hypothetical protein